MITFEHLTKKFNGTTAVDDLNVELQTGEITVLIGPSGCGKTTTLRMINRLIEPTEGSISIDGKDISESDPVSLRRNIGYVIQQTGLFPHMSIAQNIGLVPYVEKWDEEKRKSRIEELLEFVGMPAADFYDRYPNELSGGQQQRVGVARALAADPEIILMDEPFGALDPITRVTLQDELLKMQETIEKTIVFVTHDMDEALKLADKIAIMQDGKIIQYDTPEQILRNPANEFVKEFIGNDRILKQPEYINVKDIMIKNPVTIRPERTLAVSLEKMRQQRVDSLMVVDRTRTFLGLITVNNIHDHFNQAETIGEILGKDFHYVNEEANVSEVLSLMAENNIGYVPVIDNDRHLLGLITRSSLVNVLGNAEEKNLEGELVK